MQPPAAPCSPLQSPTTPESPPRRLLRTAPLSQESLDRSDAKRGDGGALLPAQGRPWHAASHRQVLGGIGVLEMAQPLDMERVTKLLVERGVWLRPFGKLLYAMPPFVISERELAAVTDAMAAVVDAVEREAI